MLFSTISFLARSLNGEESLRKINNSRFHIRIRIFTKIESIRPCDTANLEPVHQVLSVSVHYFLKHCGMYNFLDIVLSPLSLNGEESRKKIQVVRS